MIPSEHRPSFWPSRNQRLTGLLMLALVAWVGLKARNEARQYAFIGVPLERNTIVISGEGKVSAIPDVSLIDLGMSAERSTVSAAQTENARVMNAVIAKLKTLGVSAKDIQTTNYTVYPAYDYANNRQQPRGYSVNQNVRIKVRKLDSVSDILDAAGKLGANQIGNVSFSVDNPEKLRQEARIKAVANAKEKAQALADAVGVKLRRVVSFNESVGGTPGPIMYAKAYALDAGGAAPAAPSVEPGSTEITVNAEVTYEIE